jgi:autotransporter-associated beta strand protein
VTPNVHTWTGSSSSGSWSNPSNWVGGAPTPGESSPVVLNFGPGLSNQATVDDVANLTVNQVNITATGYSVTLAASLTIQVDSGTSADLAAAISGPGGITLTGQGTLILPPSVANSYTGTTTVNGGFLLVLDSQLSSPVTVNNGGKLGGSGTVGTTVVNAGGTLAPVKDAMNTPSDLTVRGNLTLEPGSRFSVYIKDQNKNLSNGKKVIFVQEHSAVTVTGQAFVAGSILDAHFVNPNLKLTPGPSAVIHLILDTSNQPPVGTFANLPQHELVRALSQDTPRQCFHIEYAFIDKNGQGATTDVAIGLVAVDDAELFVHAVFNALGLQTDTSLDAFAAMLRSRKGVLFTGDLLALRRQRVAMELLQSPLYRRVEAVQIFKALQLNGSSDRFAPDLNSKPAWMVFREILNSREFRDTYGRPPARRFLDIVAGAVLGTNPTTGLPKLTHHDFREQLGLLRSMSRSAFIQEFLSSAPVIQAAVFDRASDPLFFQGITIDTAHYLRAIRRGGLNPDQLTAQLLSDIGDAFVQKFRAMCLTQAPPVSM